jgi:hypothetical protein
VGIDPEGLNVVGESRMSRWVVIRVEKRVQFEERGLERGVRCQAS